MILLHGSTNKFDTFKISKELSTHTFLAEGHGIYMTTDMELASGYGSYLYHIEVDEDDIQDFTNELEIKLLIKEVEKDIDINLSEYFNLSNYIEGITRGDYSATGIGKDVCDMLDSNEYFYNNFQDQITYEDDCIMKKIQKSFMDNMKDIIKYYDKSFKQSIYICIKNPETLEISKVEKIY